jgi:hypothetical protein
MPPPQAPRLTGSGRRRRAGLIIAALLGVPLGVVLLAVGVVAAMALSGASIDASRWRAARRSGGPSSSTAPSNSSRGWVAKWACGSARSPSSIRPASAGPSS